MSSTEHDSRPVGIGAMRLSTVPDRDDERGMAVLCAAIDAGVDLIDTSDAYAYGEDDIGHNERLVALARAARPGRTVRVVTKGGLLRPGGAWVPDGRAKHLAAAARASRERLGGAPIDLYLLHAMDPRVPFTTSVRALGKLVEDRVVAKVGVANVDRTRLEEALAITELAAVSVELSPFRTAALDGGVVALCEERGIQLLAHRPFGGAAHAHRLAKHPVIEAIVRAHGLSPAAATIAWLRALSPVIVPLPGPTRVHDDGSLNPPEIELERARTQVAVPATDGDVVLIVGPPGAGKSTIARELVARGYHRLNRDELGGKLAGLAVRLEGALSGGERNVVLDNTYPTRATRAPVIAAARRHGVPVRCIELVTSLEDAQVNAVTRLLDRYGRLPEPDEYPALAKQDANTFQPNAQFRYRRQYEPPRADEGFTAIEHRPFVRAPGGGTRRAVIVELDGVAWGARPASPAAIELVDGIVERVAAWDRAGWLVLATAWMPDVAEPDAICAAVQQRIPAIRAIARCTHTAGPPICWCRKPLPGMGLLLARAHDVDLAASIHVGTGPADRTFAARLGLAFVASIDAVSI